jgi:hypothetical protein
MAAAHNPSNVHHDIAQGTDCPVLDVLGPTIEFLTSPDEADDRLCVMRGVIPPLLLSYLSTSCGYFIDRRAGEENPW